MNSIQTKNMFTEVVNAAAKNKQTLSVNLNEVESRVAKNIEEKSNVTVTDFKEMVNHAKGTNRELVIPAETLRAYAGIDQPIKVYSHNFPKPKN